MFIRSEEWNRVMDQFTEAEKEILNKSYAGESICPRGMVLDEKKAGEAGRKLKMLLKGVQNAKAKR